MTIFKTVINDKGKLSDGMEAVLSECMNGLITCLQSAGLKGKKAMNDPYRVLGITSAATDEEVKKAYRELAKKYHPDKYVNSPLAEAASEKMKEINEAYDRILEERKNARSQGQNYESYHHNRSRFENIRIMINNGDFSGAESALSAIPSDQRDAEWYYLMGIVVYRKGWLEDAYNYFQTACRMDPNNEEYQSIYRRVKQQRGRTGRCSDRNDGRVGMLRYLLVPDLFGLSLQLLPNVKAARKHRQKIGSVFTAVSVTFGYRIFVYRK